MRYADVILPLPFSESFTYSIPDIMRNDIQPGCRVVVPFGSRKIYTGIVLDCHDNEPEGYTVKDIMEVPDGGRSIIYSYQMDLWKWIAGYYMCSLGEVYKAALPSGLKLESESKVMISPDYDGLENCTPLEQKLITLLRSKANFTLQQLQKSTDFAVMRVARNLLEKGLIRISEEVRRTYKPRMETYVRLASDLFDEERLNDVFDTLKRSRASKQMDMFVRYLDLSDVPSVLQSHNKDLLKEVSRRTLVESGNYSTAICSSLVERGYLELYTRELGRLDSSDIRKELILSPLSAPQEKAFLSIQEGFRQRPVCLFHGVTSSGKTEVYIHLIADMLEQKRQVLYLVPEIALTTQLTDRLYKVFGSRMGVYHSKFSDAERVEIWKKQLTESPYELIVGVRSSVFLPFDNLGLVIIDEEHETTYKQTEPAPRYHARSVALMLARHFGASTLLGTATPSMESYYNAQEGKYFMVQLSERYGNVCLPEIEVVDIKELRRKKIMKGIFSPRLVEVMNAALENKEQIILFQNRRGYSPMLECKECGWVPKCSNCDVSLTYHKGQNKLTCHYCGFTCAPPKSCPSCGSFSITHVGYGTEKIEDAISAVFPSARVSRMDLDTTRTRNAYDRIISDFQDGKTDILVGTQMVTKGLDFEKVSVVGILDADTMLNMPDFRSYERAFQMMSQVAGRAGRRQRRGLVILQTKSPELPVIHHVVSNDYTSLYNEQSEERRLFVYPPFCRLIYVYMKHRESSVADHVAFEVGHRLRELFGNRVLGPDCPPVGRVQQMFIRKLVLKIGLEWSMHKVSEALWNVRSAVMHKKEYASVQIFFDVDPM